MNYAIVQAGTVTGTALWDGVTPWAPSADAVQIPDGMAVTIGWTWDGVNFAPPSDPRTLAEAQAEALVGIDTETSRRIILGPGFEYPAGSGLYYSTTITASSKWTGWMTAILGGVPPAYPIRVFTKDDKTSVDIISDAEVTAYYGALVDRVATLITDGSPYKTAVNAATTNAECDAILAAYMMSG